jgi:large subunit ribosomal protein L13
VLGRVATLAARLLQGKHKAAYTPHIDTGDHVVVVNAGAVKLTGRKEDQKIYRRHSGYEGGLREERAGVVRKRQPARLVEEAVRGMLPKTKMGDQMYRKLKVYSRADHPHTAQQPSKIEVQ